MIVPPELEDLVRRQELDPSCTRSARRALEDVVVFQFHALADGLLAERVIREGRLSHNIAAQHFGRSDESLRRHHEGVGDQLKRFTTSVAAGTLKPILIRDLSQVRIRILGGTASLWDDAEINQQLRDLGSDIRFAFPGAARLTALVVRDVIGGADENWPIDARFILGRIGAKSCGPFGPVFDFHEELVVSPHVDPGATGLSYENKAVVRRQVARRTRLSNGDDTALSQGAHDLQYLHILIHELVHTAAYHHPSQHAYAVWHYAQDLAADVCRFTMTAKTRAEIDGTFNLSFERDIVDRKAEAVGRALPEQQLPDALGVVEALCRDEKIVFDGHSYRSTIYGEGRPWAF